MGSRKIRDIVATVGEYTDRNTGETKRRYENVGALMQNDDEDASYFIMLKRTFNPAGVPKQDERESILLSCYVPKARDDGERRESGQTVRHDRDDPRTQQGGSFSRDLDDEIPFMPEWR